jgi:hypothetical protein
LSRFEPVFQVADLLLLCLKAIEDFHLSRHIFHQLCGIRLEIVVKLLRQARKLLQCSDGLAQHGHLLEDGVVGIIEAARSL